MACPLPPLSPSPALHHPPTCSHVRPSSSSQPPPDPTQITAASDAINIAGFSNVGFSMLSVFQCITVTGWSFAFYRTTDNTSPVAAIYYVLLVSIGAYVLVGKGAAGWDLGEGLGGGEGVLLSPILEGACQLTPRIRAYTRVFRREGGSVERCGRVCSLPPTGPRLAPALSLPLKVNLFLAVLKIKFAKAQTAFRAVRAGARGRAGGLSFIIPVRSDQGWAARLWGGGRQGRLRGRACCACFLRVLTRPFLSRMASRFPRPQR